MTGARAEGFGGTRKITCLIMDLLADYFSGKLVKKEMHLQEGSALESCIFACEFADRYPYIVRCIKIELVNGIEH